MTGRKEQSPSEAVDQHIELTLKQAPSTACLFRFVRHCARMEQTPRPDGRRANISWSLWGVNGSKSSQVYLQSIRTEAARYPANPELWNLPQATANTYSTFSWRFSEAEAETKPPQQWIPSLGVSEMRTYQQKNALSLQANMGSLEGTQEDWQLALEHDPYPVIVQDRQGFLYANQAYRQQRQKK